jgi:hypothetical protein
MIGGFSVPPRTICDIKWCSGCKDHHPRSEFSTNRSKRDGLQYWCRKYSRAYWKLSRTAAEVEGA